MTSDWLMALLGGALIGGSASLLMLANGRISGISGILGGVLTPTGGETPWRVAFLLGMLLVGGLAAMLAPEMLTASVPALPLRAVVAGLLVGFGTRLGSGCTSGHGICGTSRLSARSLVAVSVFIAAGAVTVFVTNPWRAGS